MRPSVSVNVNSLPGPARFAVECCGLCWNQDLDAKLLSLHEGTAGERLTGNPGRKAEIILDACARAGLSSERPAVERDDAQAFGGRVNGGRETGRSGAHNENVEELVPWRDIEHSKAAPQRLFGRVEQHGAVGADGENLARRRIVSREHCRSRGVVVRVDGMMRVAVSLQERLQTEQPG